MQKKEISTKRTIGDTNIIRLKYPMIEVKKFQKPYQNIINKALEGKRLTKGQTFKLKFIYEVGKDLPQFPKLIKLQLAELYREQLLQFLDSEYYENAIEIRDIISELEK